MSPDIILQGLLGTNEVATAEEAFSISIRSTATLSQAFFLESIMALFAVVLLGTQVATLWPNFVMIFYLHALLRQIELVSQMVPLHARLICENSMLNRHHAYKCNEVQLLDGMRSYLRSIYSD